jgi:hypothetical protein
MRKIRNTQSRVYKEDQIAALAQKMRVPFEALQSLRAVSFEVLALIAGKL